MSRPLSPRQTATLNALTSLFNKSRAPVPRDELRKALGFSDRWLTSTIASLINRDLVFVPTQGVAAYLPTTERD